MHYLPHVLILRHLEHMTLLLFISWFVKMQTIQQNHVIKKQFGNIVPEVFSYGMSVI